jgi:hypothetical protein
VVLMSTQRSPALDGTLGNSDRLKRDLTDFGIFDTKMSLYLLYRLREFEVMGFSGFEGRHYSLFDSLTEDLSQAVDIQILVTALAFKYQAMGKLTHAQIPDSPFIESERRQIFFGAAIGIPTFLVRSDTSNQFLLAILRRTTRTRTSHRYPGLLRVHNDDYRLALLKTMREDGADLIEMFGLQETIKDLHARLEDQAGSSASGKLLRGILGGANRHLPSSPMQIKAEEFNLQAENYYRNQLRCRHLEEAFRLLIEDLRALKLSEPNFDDEIKEALHHCLRGDDAADFAEAMKNEIVNERAGEAAIQMLINLVLLSIRHDMNVSEKILNAPYYETSITATASSIH